MSTAFQSTNANQGDDSGVSSLAPLSSATGQVNEIDVLVQQQGRYVPPHERRKLLAAGPSVKDTVRANPSLAKEALPSTAPPLQPRLANVHAQFTPPSPAPVPGGGKWHGEKGPDYDSGRPGGGWAMPSSTRGAVMTSPSPSSFNARGPPSRITSLSSMSRSGGKWSEDDVSHQGGPSGGFEPRRSSSTQANYGPDGLLPRNARVEEELFAATSTGINFDKCDSPRDFETSSF